MGIIATDIIEITANLFTIFAAGIAIYLFIFKKGAISKAFKVLISYFYQMTLNELKQKLDDLTGLNVNDPTQKSEVINIFSEIVGQIRGNKKLKSEFSEILENISNLIENKKSLTEPRKRNIVSELREKLRHINVESFNEIIGRD